jgi:Photosynthetic reaction centre cytochrome C subunit
MHKGLTSPSARPVTGGIAVSLALFFAVALASQIACAQGPPQAPPGGGMRRQMPAPTNLQVLPKDTSGPELMKVMHTFEAQVGVECGFCHASDEATHRLNFASDAKPEKATARVMMRMTHDINEKYLTQINDPDHADHPAPPVTCGTCHRGKSMPEAFAAPPDGPHGPDDHHGPDAHGPEHPPS